ncbi:MAG: hemolysin family protein [Bacteroidota bacterium]
MNNWVIIIITLAFSAFFSGMEIAFISSNKLKIELDKKHGLFYAKLYSKFLNQPQNFISSMLVGNNVVLVVYSIFMAKNLEPFITNTIFSGYSNETLLMVLQTILSTLVILFVAEFFPKTIFQLNPNRILRLFAFPGILFYYLLYPIVIITTKTSVFLLKKIFRINITESKIVFEKIDLESFIEEATANNELNADVNHEIQMFQNAMDFSKIKVRECMLPRTEIIAVEVTEDIQILKEKFIETELSRILIYRNNIDNIIGYVHSHEMFNCPEYIGTALLPIPIVPESMLVSKILTMFIQQRKSIALVVDEFGGTAGLLTMEDIIEEIFGEINDEYDVDEYTEKKISENEFLFSGRLEIDYLNDKYCFNLPESDDYETLAGLILSSYRSVPAKNDVITIENFVFIITDVTDTKINSVHLTIRNE